MFGFHGDYKRQRNINLGGSRRNDSSRSNSQAVLNKAHEERQQRETERRRQKAALKIQSAWRASQATANWRQKLRSQADFTVLSHQPVDIDAVYATLAIFTAYYNAQKRDVETLQLVLRLLFDKKESSATSVYAQVAASVGQQSGQYSQGHPLESWTLVISRLFRLALKSVDSGAMLENQSLVLESLEIATKGNGETDTCALQRAVLQRLVSSKCYYHSLAHYIKAANKETASGSLKTAADLAVRPLGDLHIQSMAISLFVQHIMVIPGLPNKLGALGVASITRMPAKWSIVIKHVQDEIQQKQIRRQQARHSSTGSIFGAPAEPASDLSLELSAINMLGNMAAFVLPQLLHQGAAGNSQLIGSFIQACAACARLTPSCNLLDPPSKSSLKSATAAARLVRMANSHALKWLSTLLSVQMLKFLVPASCRHAGSGEGVDHVALAAQELLLIFIQRWGETASRAVLDNIFQSIDIRTVGWRSILDEQAFLQAFTDDRLKVETIQQYDLVRLQLLCELLNRQLQTIGDDELFSQDMSLPLGNIKVIARVCRNIAFTLYWAQGIPDDLVHIRDTATAVTQQLFIRNARHPFVEDDFWLIRPAMLDMSSFANKVAEDPIFTVDNSGDDEDEDSDSDSDESNVSSANESDGDNVMGVEQGSSGDGSATRLGWLASRYSGLRRQGQQQQQLDRSIMTPRIAILRNIPFVVPFNDRVRLFHALINRDRESLGLNPLGNGQSTMNHHLDISSVARVEVRRGSVFEDGFRGLFPVLSGKPIRGEPQHSNTNGQANEDHSGVFPYVATSSSHMPEIGAFGMDVDEMNEANDPFGAAAMFRRQGGMWPPSTQQAFPDTSFNSLSRRYGRSDIFKRRVQISFVDQYNLPEAGIDGGGVFKEFLNSLVQEAFDPRTGMFSTTNQNSLYPNPLTMQQDTNEMRLLALDKFKFLGAVIGKALYEGILVDVPFAQFFLGRCTGQLPTFNDLPTLDEQLYRGLVALKNYPVSDDNGKNGGEDEISRVFDMDFTVTESTRDGTTRVVPLVPKGESIRVTAHNRMLFLDLIAQYKLVRQIDAPTKAFLSGLHAIIPENWLRLLFATPVELSRLLCGDSGAIKIDDWKRNTHYSGAYQAKRSEHPTIVEFWDVVEHMLNEGQRRKLCKFATSCERPPLLGFAELNPQFCISSSSSDENGNHDNRLPSASTCVNLLKLPVYSSKEVLYRKLLTAIESEAGFDLS
ncbi:ubiquitin-protein ligase (E3) [Coemansia sp. Benny D115]|nr:ubiquitin-protein ligase (E3) [Coemansia sp. Benny D115]